jgi:hypothetical protein
MNSETAPEKEFIIPTLFKDSIGSYLSWPTGAAELTKAFSTAPQINELQLKFYEGLPKYPKGKWPSKFKVICLRYGNHQGPTFGTSGWEISVSPVLRPLRAKIRAALNQTGFEVLLKWLIQHANFSGRESNLSYSSIWDSDKSELTFGLHEYVLPEISKAS